MAPRTRNSRVAANRIAVTDVVASSLAVHGEEIAAALGERLALSGRSKLDSKALLDALLAALQATSGELAASDQAHALELSDDEAPRQLRDGLTLTVRDKLLSLRELLSGAYGAAVAASYLLGEALPESSQALLARGRSVAERLATVPFTAAPRHASLKLRAADLAGELVELVDALEAAIGNVRTEEREAQLTLERRNRASEVWQEVYQGVTHMAYGAYILAGRRDLAERIEPTSRKRAGIGEEPAPVPSPSPGDSPGSPGDRPRPA
ncbi:MAG: hypothetical protein U1A78_30645 [Polyangia bacterium]